MNLVFSIYQFQKKDWSRIDSMNTIIYLTGRVYLATWYIQVMVPDTSTILMPSWLIDYGIMPSIRHHTPPYQHWYLYQCWYSAMHATSGYGSQLARSQASLGWPLHWFIDLLTVYSFIYIRDRLACLMGWIADCSTVVQSNISNVE